MKPHYRLRVRQHSRDTMPEYAVEYGSLRTLWSVFSARVLMDARLGRFYYSR